MSGSWLVALRSPFFLFPPGVKLQDNEDEGGQVEKEVEDVDRLPKRPLHKHPEFLHEVRLRAERREAEKEGGEDQYGPVDPVKEFPHGQRRNVSYQRIRTAPAARTTRLSVIENPCRRENSRRAGSSSGIASREWIVSRTAAIRGARPYVW